MSLIFWIVLFIFAASFSYAGYLGAPWVPTRSHERKRLLELVDIKPGQVVYDIGCGNGAILFDAADRFPDATYRGYDLSLFPLLLAWVKKMRNAQRYRQVSIRFGNAYKQDISDGDLIFIYLLENNYHRLLKFLHAANIKPEAIVIIEGWPLEGKNFYFKNDQKGYLPLYFYRGSDFNTI